MTPRRLAGQFLVLATVALLALAGGVLLSGGTAMAQDDFIDYDVDNDRLIEVSNLAQLNAMRWDGFGNGAPTSADQAAYLEAFPGGNVVTSPKMGCPMTCKGYELTADLDFDTNGNLTADAGDEYWNDGAGWAPIFGQTSGSSFEAIFEGNGHVISNLFINRTTGRNGLFGHIFNEVTVREDGTPTMTALATAA